MWYNIEKCMKAVSTDGVSGFVFKGRNGNDIYKRKGR